MKKSKRILAAMLSSAVLFHTAWGVSLSVNAAEPEQSVVQTDESENESDTVLVTAFKDGEKISVESEQTTQGQVFYLSEGTVLNFQKPQNETGGFSYKYLYKDMKTNITFTPQIKQNGFVFKAVKKGSFQVTVSRYSETVQEDMVFLIIVNEGQDEYSDNLLNVEDEFKINMGMSRTIALSDSAYSFVGVDKTDRAEITQVSKNVINFSARKAGTVYLCTIGQDGTERTVKINIRDCIYRTPKNDIVKLNSAAFSTSIIPDDKELKRNFSVNTGKTISFSKTGDFGYTYEYFYRNEYGQDICIRPESEEDYFKFTPMEAKKYVISVIVRDHAKNFSKKEVFTVTAKGNALDSAKTIDTIQRTQTKKFAFADTVKEVWSSNDNISYHILDREVSFNGVKEGTTEFLIMTEKGYIYENYFKVAPRQTEPFVLKNKTVTLDVGNTYKIAFATKGDNTDFTYQSSAPSVAEVSKDGTVKAVRAGEAEIIVANKINADKIKINVDTSSIKLNAENMQLFSKGQFVLKPILDAGSKTAVTFSSSDTSVASVDKNGTVTANKGGTAVIAARTANNKTAFCKVTVIEIPDSVHISFASVCPTVHIGQTVTLGINISDSRYAKYISVSVSDKSKASVSYKDGKCTIKGLKPGKLYLTASFPNGRSISTLFYSTGNYSAYRTNYEVERGIDVSCFNDNVNYQRLRELGYTFIIIRDGFGNELSQKDEYFEKHILGAKKAGLGIGIYHFCYALNAADAKKEAKICNQIISKYRGDITHGVYYDYEEDSRRYAEKRGYYQNRQVVTDIVDTFCSEMERYGFVAGVYTDTYDRETYFDMNRLDKYLFWYAAPGFTSFKYEFDIWQYTFELRSSAFSGYADGNKIYSTIFKQLR